MYVCVCVCVPPLINGGRFLAHGLQDYPKEWFNSVHGTGILCASLLIDSGHFLGCYVL